MKIHTKKINDLSVTAYNDSGIEWVVTAGDMTPQRFNTKKWSMKAAMEFAAVTANFQREEQ